MNPVFKQSRKEWGCDAPSGGEEAGGFIYQFGDYTLDRCPNSLLKSPWIQEVIKLFGFYKRNILPRGSDLRSQTKMYLETMSALEHYNTEAQTWFESEKEKRKP